MLTQLPGLDHPQRTPPLQGIVERGARIAVGTGA